MFLPFPRLPYELRLKTWRLALEFTIVETWNNSNFQWELNPKVPSAAQAAHEVRAEFFNMYSKVAMALKKKAEGDNVVEDILPFYFSYTLCVRREFHFNIKVLSKSLCSLQMDWGMEPYWWLGSEQKGPALLREFLNLEIFTLVIRTSRTARKDQDMMNIEAAKKYTIRVVEIERGQYPEWRVPKIKFNWKKGQDWKVYSIAESLLPENQIETAPLYSWAFQ